MIRAVLFDADGVLQWPTAGAIEAFTALGGGRPGFVEDLLAEESTTMTGKVELADVLQTVIERYSLTISVEDLIRIWYRIELREPMLALAAEARAAGLRTALATNQQPYRGAWMQQNLPYADYFDQLCYSFELGVAKPDPEFFGEVVRRLGVAPEEAVMIDDLPENIEAARSAGLQGIVCDRVGDPDLVRAQLAQLNVPGF
jgi:putative hydrolase of the HAD superfamily